jgi:choline dehydrogenase-like flavoprotein
MIVDARSVPENETVETDVCVVGAGIAGITIAREFSNRGFEVCLLESGDLKFDEKIQALGQGENIGHPYFPLDTARARQFGGSANFWDIDLGMGVMGARLRPLDPIDFEKRDWIPYSGWPFGKPELDPYYERAQSFFRVEPTGFDLQQWDDPQNAARLPLLNGRVQTVIFKFGRGELFTQDYRYEVTQLAENILSFLFANVTELETDEVGRSVKRVHVTCLGGSTFWVSAKVFILAAGGIETPRLLLQSNKTCTAGLGNDHDLVGRFFMEHLHFASGWYLPSDPEIWQRAALYKSIRQVNQVPIIGKLTVSEKVLRGERLLNQNVQLIPRTLSPAQIYGGVLSEGIVSLQALRTAIRGRTIPSDFFQHLLRVGRHVNHVGINIGRKLRTKWAGVGSSRMFNVFRLAHMAEQVPNPDSRVRLSAERDGLGQYRVRLDWKPTELDFCSVVRTQKIIDEELRRANLGRLYIQLRGPVAPPDLHGGYHHMGTTRMHDDPKKGVVDRNCRVHGMANLFIAGPSVFPTGGYANPTLTTVALALRLADRVKGIMA